LTLERGSDGLGLQLTPREPTLISGVAPGGVAARAHIKAGDMIMAVDGTPCDAQSIMKLIRNAGAAVELTVSREAAEEIVEHV
jgi:C-terminal processing protease CtpA/Prc